MMKRCLATRACHSRLFACLKLKYASKAIDVTPNPSLFDQDVSITLSDLEANQMVTIVAKTEENRNTCTFESRCVVMADENGMFHNHRNPSLAGTFTGVEPMGLFWSLAPRMSAPFVKKDVTKPVTYSIDVFDGSRLDDDRDNKTPMASTEAFRLFKRVGVRRISLDDGPFKGTIFVPEGEGPFPAVVDLYGGFVRLKETRAALLASYGYTTYALSYLHDEGLAQTVLSTDFDYVYEAVKWFSRQHYVDDTRVGAIGLCFGGTLCLYVASLSPLIKAVVNINGTAFHAGKLFNFQNNGNKWPNPDLTYLTEEGVVLTECLNTDNYVPIPAWKHGAKLLQICGDDDKQIHPKWSKEYETIWPNDMKPNFELITYPGAGHVIEPPNTPLCRAPILGRKLMKSLELIPSKLYEEPLLFGGYPKEHAYAQKDAWNRMLTFLHKNVMTLNYV